MDLIKLKDYLNTRQIDLAEILLAKEAKFTSALYILYNGYDVQNAVRLLGVLSAISFTLDQMKNAEITPESLKEILIKKLASGIYEEEFQTSSLISNSLRYFFNKGFSYQLSETIELLK